MCEFYQKRSSKILADENRNFFGEKVKLGENFPWSLKNLSEVGGNLKQGEMHHCLRGDERSCM